MTILLVLLLLCLIFLGFRLEEIYWMLKEEIELDYVKEKEYEER